jgi:hypothetical protein
MSLDGDPEGQAGKHRTAIQQHGATSALPQLTAMFGAGERQVFAKDFQKRFMRGKRHFDRLTIYPQGNMRLRQLAVAFLLGWFHSLAVGYTCSDLLARPERDITTCHFWASNRRRPGRPANLG